MGAFAPTPAITHEEAQEWAKSILQATVAGLRKEGNPFVGVLFAGNALFLPYSLPFCCMGVTVLQV